MDEDNESDCDSESWWAGVIHREDSRKVHCKSLSSDLTDPVPVGHPGDSSIFCASDDFVRIQESDSRREEAMRGTSWESLDDLNVFSHTARHRISQGWLAVESALQGSSTSDTEI